MEHYSVMDIKISNGGITRT